MKSSSMRAAVASVNPQPKIFGIHVGVDPKILAGALGLISIALFWLNTRSSDVPLSAAAPPAVASPAIQARYRTIPKLRRQAKDRDTIQMKRIDPGKGDIDPTLNLNLLARLHSVEAVSGGRNLFEFESAPVSNADQAILDNPPVVPKLDPVPVSQTTLPASVVLPPMSLKYYGFVKSKEGSEKQQGLFLDGDNLMVGSEGQLLAHRYRVVELTSQVARIEDTEIKNSETLTVVPAVGSSGQ